MNLLDQLLKNKYFIAMSKLKEFLIVLLFFFAFLKGPLTEPDIEVTYETLASVPGLKTVHIIDSLNSVSKALSMETLAWLQPLADRIFSQTMLVVTITNNLDKKVSGFELQVNGVSSIYDVDIESDVSSVIGIKDNLAKFTMNSSGTAIFSELKELPPNAKLTLYIFGKISPSLLYSQVTISSSAEHSTCHEISEASGLAVLLGGNAIYLIAILLGSVLLIGLNRLRRQP